MDAQRKSAFLFPSSFLPSSTRADPFRFSSTFVSFHGTSLPSSSSSSSCLPSPLSAYIVHHHPRRSPSDPSLLRSLSPVCRRPEWWQYAEKPDKTLEKFMLFVVAVALIDPMGRVLLFRRGRLWEFPGGRVDKNETLEMALIREIEDEFKVKVDVQDLTPLTFASYSYSLSTTHLFMPLYMCTTWHGKLKQKKGRELVWASLEQLDTLYRMTGSSKSTLPMVKAAMRKISARYQKRARILEQAKTQSSYQNQNSLQSPEQN